MNTVVLALVSAVLTSGASAPLDGLHVQGKNLLDKGKTVHLRGVCVGDVILARQNRLGDYRVLAKDWKCNTVRIGVAPSSWKHDDKKKVFAELKKEVKAARAQGLYVLIDWHAIGWPDGYFQKSTVKDLYDSSFSLATDFWKTCAKEFKTDNRVGFHLWCEPLYTEKDWETPYGSTWPELKTYFDRLIGDIRKSGAKNLVIASGNRWAYDLNGIKQNPIKDSNVAYEWHVYGGHDKNDPKLWAKALGDVHTFAPVIVSEWGFQADTNSHFKGTPEDFGKPFVKFMRERKLHWTAWCYHPQWGPAMLEKDWKTPTSYGKFVKDLLAEGK